MWFVFFIVGRRCQSLNVSRKKYCTWMLSDNYLFKFVNICWSLVLFFRGWVMRCCVASRVAYGNMRTACRCYTAVPAKFSMPVKPDDEDPANLLIIPMIQSTLARPNTTAIVVTSLGDKAGKAGLSQFCSQGIANGMLSCCFCVWYFATLPSHVHTGFCKKYRHIKYLWCYPGVNPEVTELDSP